MRVLYRADGGHPVGTGHLFRAKRLLEALARRIDLEAVLLTAEDRDALNIAKAVPARLELLAPRRDLTAVKPCLDAQPVVTALGAWRPDVVVVDMLDTPDPDMEAIASTGVPVVTLDDRGDGRFHAHALVNVLVAEPDPERLQQTTCLLQGPAYVTLDGIYARAHADARPREFGPHRRVLVATGGGDAAGLTVKVAEALRLVGSLDRVVIACGPAFPHRARLDAALADAPWPHQIHTSRPNLIDAYRDCDLALVAGGLTMHEVCCLGTPALAVCQPIDHQQELAERFARAGAMATVGYGLDAPVEKIAAAVQRLLDDSAARRRMAEVGPQLVDGRGTERVAEALARFGS